MVALPFNKPISLSSSLISSRFKGNVHYASLSWWFAKYLFICLTRIMISIFLSTKFDIFNNLNQLTLNDALQFFFKVNHFSLCILLFVASFFGNFLYFVNVNNFTSRWVPEVRIVSLNPICIVDCKTVQFKFPLCSVLTYPSSLTKYTCLNFFGAKWLYCFDDLENKLIPKHCFQRKKASSLDL